MEREREKRGRLLAGSMGVISQDWYGTIHMQLENSYEIRVRRSAPEELRK